MNIKEFYDNVFGNRDGKFDMKDLPNHAVLIVGLIADLLMAFAEYRVYSVGKALTGNTLLALGFVAVSSVPFYLGQLAFLYNRANDWQQRISVGMVFMGLFVSAYYGFADFILETNTTLAIAKGVRFSVDVQTLYIVAVAGTVSIIISGLMYVFLDDGIANTVKKNRIVGLAEIAQEEITIKRKLLAGLTALRRDEEALKSQYPEDYDRLQAEFLAITNKKKNPTNGNGS